jgi:catechol 2,3-dioxygenase-like lactoylglutathione lyase family enzyme
MPVASLEQPRRAALAARVPPIGDPLVRRIGHIGLRVADLDRSVEFYSAILGLRETERAGRVSYLTCNARHHELVLIQSRVAGYDHVALEVGDLDALDRAQAILRGAGADIGRSEDEPGVGRTLAFFGPERHRFKLFCGIEQDLSLAPPAGADAPESFEHITLKVRKLHAMESLIEQLGFVCSDRMGRLASWYRCDERHHGIGLSLAPTKLHHYAWGTLSLDAMGRIADRLTARGQKLVWGPGRHGPGNNMFIYFLDPDGFMVEVCADLALVGPDHDYVPSRWPSRPSSLSRWGSIPPIRFLHTGVPPARADA